ncbi:antirestriction protein ArdA [uncultured Cohaesibacter sp.]|uniref:antirestriction protein ArdA n=1 Tax=uncultured Cohaesibacter sp. TaxID=1002546 RepID=UPI0029C657AE|nr:antirestriction protein ArdA [uncultured Cohaesibacter sp.]
MSDLRIYIADLAAYNAGCLRGGWIDLDGVTSTDDVWDEIKRRRLLGRNGDEWNEYAIHDHEGFGSMLLGEYSGLDTAVNVAILKGEAEEDDIPWEAVIGYAENMGRWPDNTIDIRDRWVGEHNNFREYAEELFDDCYANEVPEFIQNYIDYDAYARDLAMDYLVIDSEQGVYIFNN